MLQYLTSRRSRGVPLHLVNTRGYARWLRQQPVAVRRWLKNIAFSARAGQVALVPGAAGELSGAVAVLAHAPSQWEFARLPRSLPERVFQITGEVQPKRARSLALGWALGTYEFTKYKKSEHTFAKLVWPDGADRREVTRLVEGVCLCRDLINTPANDMGPAELTAAGGELAKRHGARVRTIVGNELLRRNYPAIHAVGRASTEAPRLFDMIWGNPRDPKLTLVGKGVCFDSGGLDLKPASAMQLMKKDMGGAATVLGLAHAIMAAKLSVRLRVLIPAVENAVAGNAFRPLDVLETRKGLSVEVGNTDAEGRLILCDAMTEADREDPDLLIDIATLTGSARVALGTHVPALFASSSKLSRWVLSAGERIHDPLWELPLHGPYKRQLSSHVADLVNVPNGPYGGAITAALFLREFISKQRNWLHIDTMAYNRSSSPGRPIGGEAMGLMALATALEQRYPPRAGSARARRKS